MMKVLFVKAETVHISCNNLFAGFITNAFRHLVMRATIPNLS